MYIIVSTDQRIPVDLENGFQVEQWTPNEFFTRASDDEGLEIDEGIWYDVADLTAEIYEGLAAYVEAGINIIYYRFDNRPTPSFPIAQDIKVYSTHIPEPQVEAKEEPIPITPVAPAAPVAPQAPPMQPTIQQMPPQPQMYEQPVYQQPMQTGYPQQPYPQMQGQMYSQPPVQQPMQQPMAQPTLPQPPIQPTPMPSAPQSMSSQKPETPVSMPSIQELTAEQMKNEMHNMLQFDDYDAGDRSRGRKAAPAKVILFGSSKGGSGKTTTCLMTAYWYAKSHPTQKIAVADFDIIDGQIGISINKLTPTMQDYYKLYKNEHKDFTYLDNCKVKSDKFTPNVDFFLAPSQDIPTITNDVEFWNDIFQKLITNYDLVFFDSGIDYIGKPPISQLYKIADHIIITCNTSINSTKSVIKQFKTLSGARANNVFRKGDDILNKVKVVLTRMSDMQDVNNIVVQNLSSFAPVVAQFGQIDKELARIQWYQMWTTIDTTPAIVDQLNKIIDF